MNEASASGTVHVIVPDAIDDPTRPSGGNRYDRRICSGLPAAGWHVREHAVPDSWPRLNSAGARATARLVADLPDGALVLVDGLIASAAAEVFVPAAARLSVVVLVHLPLGDDPATRAAEAAVLTAARAVIATSGWTRDRLLADYAIRPVAVQVDEPGVDPAELSIGTTHGTQLLCVAPVAAQKGHDLLLAALTSLAEHEWCCTCVGPLDRDPAFAADLRASAEAAGLAGRLRLAGAMSAGPLDRAYRSADLLVHAARGETYGMVVTEALAHGVPVIAAAAGGLPQALGRASDGVRPGVLVPVDDAQALTGALRRWLTDPALRRQLRRAALDRRTTLRSWRTTIEEIAYVLTTAAA